MKRFKEKVPVEESKERKLSWVDDSVPKQRKKKLLGWV